MKLPAIVSLPLLCQLTSATRDCLSCPSLENLIAPTLGVELSSRELCVIGVVPLSSRARADRGSQIVSHSFP